MSQVVHATPKRSHCYPAAVPDKRPSAWWYYGRALYVSRRDYFKIYCALMITLGIPMVLLNLYFHWSFWRVAALEAGTVSLFYLGYSLLVGMYRMYGHPGQQYVKRLLDESRASHASVVADLHIGTYRHSHILADLLPHAVIHSIDCWAEAGCPKEIAIRDVRDLECAPLHNPRILPSRADAYALALPDNSCDAVVFGFGTHEVPNDGSRAKLFAEAKRVLKPGGKALMFEHGYDFHNVIIFGPVIGHVVTKEEWMYEFKKHFANNGYARSSHAVDLFWGTKAEPVGTVSAPLPKPKGFHGNYRDWIVVVLFSSVSLALVAYMPDSMLLGIYWGIAILGLVWPWLTIGAAVLCDRVTRARTAS
jgi:SAM-dependent methyltransferase